MEQATQRHADLVFFCGMQPGVYALNERWLICVHLHVYCGHTG